MAIYTPIVSPATITNLIYPEVLNEITRDNTAIAIEAIDNAISEVKMYLTRYNLIALFGDPLPTQQNPQGIAATFTDTHLTNMVKIVAIWNLMPLANVNINYEDARNRYKDTIEQLKRIQDGKSSPEWPYNDITQVQTPPSLEVYSIAQPKRNNTGYVEEINTANPPHYHNNHNHG